MEQLANEVRTVVASELMLDVDAVSDSLGPGEIARWDSIGHLQILRAVEQRFGIVFTVADVMAVTSVADLVALVRRYAVGIRLKPDPTSHSRGD